MEEEAANEMEMAAQANEKREKTEKTAQGWINYIKKLQGGVKNFNDG